MKSKNIFLGHLLMGPQTKINTYHCLDVNGLKSDEQSPSPEFQFDPKTDQKLQKLCLQDFSRDFLFA